MTGGRPDLLLISPQSSLREVGDHSGLMGTIQRGPPQRGLRFEFRWAQNQIGSEPYIFGIRSVRIQIGSESDRFGIR